MIYLSSYCGQSQSDMGIFYLQGENILDTD